MVEVAHVPPPVGITAPEEARESSGESKYIIETRRMARRRSALNSYPFPGDCSVRDRVFVGFFILARVEPTEIS